MSKKLLPGIFIFVVIFAFSALVFSREPEVTNYLCRGDINEDGQVNIFDLLEMIGVLRNPEGYDKRARQIADMNASGRLDVFDLLAIMKIISGKENKIHAELVDSFFDADFHCYTHFLLVDTSLIASNHIKFLESGGTPLKDEKKRPVNIRVFKDDGNMANNYKVDDPVQRGFLYVDPQRPGSYPMYDGEFGFFNEMKLNKDYILEQCGIVISFNWVDEREKIGVIYETLGGEKVGSLVNDTLYMKLIKSASMNPMSPSWPLMLRNVYLLGSGAELNPQDFFIDIFTNQTPPKYGEQGMTFLQIFGLDDNGDNQVDSLYVDFTRGLIFFPSLEPFDRPYDTIGEIFDLSERNEHMYIEDDPSRMSADENRKYRIVVRFNPVPDNEIK